MVTPVGQFSDRWKLFLYRLKHFTPVAWTLALTCVLFGLCLLDTTLEGEPLLVLLILGLSLALYSAAALGYLIVSADTKAEEWGHGLTEPELDLLYDAPRLPLEQVADILGTDTVTGLTQRHALAREAELALVSRRRSSSAHSGTHSLLLALHEEAWGPSSWCTATLLALAIVQTIMLPPASPMLPLALALILLLLVLSVLRRWRALWCLRMCTRGAAGGLPALGPVSVVRDGEVMELPAERVVVGDLLLLTPGQELCADVRLVEAEAGPSRRIKLEMDESDLDRVRGRLAALGVSEEARGQGRMEVLCGVRIGGGGEEGGGGGAHRREGEGEEGARELEDREEKRPPPERGWSQTLRAQRPPSTALQPHVSFSQATFSMATAPPLANTGDAKGERGPGSPSKLDALAGTEQGPVQHRRRTYMALAGSVVTQGRGRGVVVSLPPHTEMGRLTRLLKRAEWVQRQAGAEGLGQGDDEPSEGDVAALAPRPLSPRLPPSTASPPGAPADVASSPHLSGRDRSPPAPALALPSSAISIPSPPSPASQQPSSRRRPPLGSTPPGASTASLFGSGGRRMGRGGRPLRSTLSPLDPDLRRETLPPRPGAFLPFSPTAEHQPYPTTSSLPSHQLPPALHDSSFVSAAVTLRPSLPPPAASSAPALPRLLFDPSLTDLEDLLLWTGVLVSLASLVSSHALAKMEEREPLLGLMGALSLLYAVAPRGDLREMWRQALSVGAWAWGKGRGRGAMGLREGEGVQAVERLALMGAVVLDKAGTLTRDAPLLRALGLATGLGTLRVWGAGAEEGLAALRGTLRRRVGAGSPGGRDGGGTAGGEEEGEREGVRELLEAWLLTSSLGDEATRREQMNRRQRNLARKGERGLGVHTHSVDSLPALASREGLAGVLSRLLNVDKEWTGLPPIDRALLSALASPPSQSTGPQASQPSVVPPRSPSSPRPSVQGGHSPPSPGPCPSSLPPPPTQSPPRPTDLPPALLSMLLGKIRGEARLVSYSPYDAEAGFEARTYAWKSNGKEGGRNGQGRGQEQAVYKTFFRATPEAILAHCDQVAELGAKRGEGGQQGSPRRGRGGGRGSVSLHPALRQCLDSSLAALAEAEGCTLVGLAVKEEEEMYEKALWRAREAGVAAWAGGPRLTRIVSDHEGEREADREEGGAGAATSGGEDEGDFPTLPPTLRTAGANGMEGGGCGRGPSIHGSRHGASFLEAAPERLDGARFLGVLAFLDPPVEGVEGAVRALRGRRGRGRRVVLVTGEGEEAAETLARQVGLLEGRRGGKEVLYAPHARGPFLSLALEEDEKVAVVCRASPQDRVRVVQAMEGGEGGGRAEEERVVAVTGNGAADVPALLWPSSLGVVLEGGAAEGGAWDAREGHRPPTGRTEAETVGPGRGRRRSMYPSHRVVSDIARRVANLAVMDGGLPAFASAAACARHLLRRSQAAATHTLACHFALALLWLPVLWLTLKGVGGPGRGFASLPLVPVQILLLEGCRMVGVGAGFYLTGWSGGAGGEEVGGDDAGSHRDRIHGVAGGRCRGPSSSAREVGSHVSLSSSASASSHRDRNFLRPRHILLVIAGILSLVTAVAVPLAYNEVFLADKETRANLAERRQTLLFTSLLLAHPLLALHLHHFLGYIPSRTNICFPWWSFTFPKMKGRVGYYWCLAWLTASFAFLLLVALDVRTQTALGLVPMPLKLWEVVLGSVVLALGVWMHVGMCAVWCVERGEDREDGERKGDEAEGGVGRNSYGAVGANVDRTREDDGRKYRDLEEQTPLLTSTHKVA